uniref:Uncharacterized protein n=1 Tax=Anguilla anguilla TaxID=7936 RepID=A0A0E9TX15_ANGAN
MSLPATRQGHGLILMTCGLAFASPFA